MVEEERTTGENQSESMVHYTKMNAQRMKRWLSKCKLTEDSKRVISEVDQAQNWTVITEAWCGDSAHSFPFIQLLADENPLINLEWILRDENIEFMDQYLTNGSRSIPKLIAFDENEKVLFEWGPRPAFIQEYVMESKANGLSYDEMNLALQKMYNADNGQTVQKEIIDLICENLKLAG